MTLLSRACVSPFLYSIETMSISHTVSENGVTLKPRVAGGRSKVITQGLRLSIGRPLYDVSRHPIKTPPYFLLKHHPVYTLWCKGRQPNESPQYAQRLRFRSYRFAQYLHLSLHQNNTTYLFIKLNPSTNPELVSRFWHYNFAIITTVFYKFIHNFG